MSRDSLLSQVTFAIATLLLLPVPPARGQGPAAAQPWVYWDSAQRLRAQASIESSEWTHYPYPGSEERSGGHAAATLLLELEREVPKGYAGSTIWRAVEMRVEGSSSSWRRSESNTGDLQSYEENGSFSQSLAAGQNESVQLEDIHLTLDHETNEWQLVTPSNIAPYSVQYDGKYRTSSSGRTDVISEVRSATEIVSFVFDGKAVSGAGILQASDSLEFKDSDGTNGWLKTGRITVLPEWDDVKLVLTLECHDPQASTGSGGQSPPAGTGRIACDKWRPRGSIVSPGGAGNHLRVTAELRPLGRRSSSAPPKVRLIRFELLGTSQEPGVAANWPLFSSDDAPDLMLTSDASSPGFPKNEGQLLEVSKLATNASGWPVASARIESFDFGGRTQLRVFAELEGRRLVAGRVEGDAYAPYLEIPIPKRRPGRWIAEAWLADKEAAGLPDDDDAESLPEGDGHGGDGLTLYEEYRGFVVDQAKGTRMEGDPKRKDLFVLNLIGDDAELGMDLFEKASRLRVVRSRDVKAMDEEKRVINANKGAAPHRVNQHGVVLKTLVEELPYVKGYLGAEAFLVESHDRNFAQRPGTTRVVGVPPRAHERSLFNKPFNLPDDDFAMSWDMVIAHELLHSVGVFHHGFSDHDAEFRYIPASYKGNTRGEPVLWMRYGTPEWKRDIDVLEEATGASFAKKLSPAFDTYLDWLCAEHVDTLELTPGARFADVDISTQDILIQQLPIITWVVGVEHGQHSGHEQCLMRYAHADLFQATDRSIPRETYYLVTPGTEDVGVDLCDSPAGTGVNGSNRKVPPNHPQPRYGDAWKGKSGNYGNCEAQICVNDDAPPRKLGYGK